MKMNLLTALIVLTTSFFFEVSAEEPKASVKVEFKDQKQSVTPWGSIPLNSFLNFQEWKEESDIRDQVPEWEKIIRERNHREMVGRMYQCIGTCRIDRGESFFNGSHRTALYEGDEIQTVGDSYTWIFLFDGTMVRLSPRSSITFNELNIGVQENFLSARFNAGNILWLSRYEHAYLESNVRETDVMFFPYAEYESLPITEKKLYMEDDLLELITENKSQLNHYNFLNETITENNKRTHGKATYAFLVTPNATLMGVSPSVEVVTLIGGKTFFKKRSSQTLGLNVKDESLNDVYLQLRGFDNKALTTIQDDLWITVDEKGRNYAQSEDVRWLDVGEFITRRIPSIIMGREIFLKKYSEFAFREKYDPIILAKNDGYRMWGKLTSNEGEKKADLELRLDFLKEYFRRVETSNLLTSSRFRERFEARGEKNVTTEYGNYFFITALNKYYKFGEALSEKSNDKETGEVLNSTTKLLWKKMHGIR
jgi:hypothetical protein